MGYPLIVVNQGNLGVSRPRFHLNCTRISLPSSRHWPRRSSMQAYNYCYGDLELRQILVG
ncbi:hypothetical protein SCLCIDRAFT_1224712, partial [Scleroderma citrinum Foug A]